jgi:hypothetical protein
MHHVCAVVTQFQDKKKHLKNGDFMIKKMLSKSYKSWSSPTHYLLLSFKFQELLPGEIIW